MFYRVPLMFSQGYFSYFKTIVRATVSINLIIHFAGVKWFFFHSRTCSITQLLDTSRSSGCFSLAPKKSEIVGIETMEFPIDSNFSHKK